MVVLLGENMTISNLLLVVRSSELGVVRGSELGVIINLCVYKQHLKTAHLYYNDVHNT